MIRKAYRLFTVLLLIALLTCFPVFSFAGEVDILLRKLVEKGILSKPDAEEILQEIRQETAKQEQDKQGDARQEQEKQAAAKQEQDKQEEAKKAESKIAETFNKWWKELPEWVKNVKFKGDLSLRYQMDDRSDDGIEPRHRGRFRLRLGAETKVIEDVKVGFGLASGSGDPRSPYVTFENTFEGKNIRIDYAFAEYSPTKWLSLIGGKFKNPLWRPSTLLWDANINPEGAAVNVHTGLLQNVDFFFNTGFFILDERSNGHDPIMFALQPTIDWRITKDIDLTFALTYYLFCGVKGTTLDYSTKTNTRVNNNLKYDYSAPALSGAVAFTNPAGLTFIPQLWLISDFIYNPYPKEENLGYLVGVGVGSPEIKRFADWQVQFSYRKLEKDAWLDVFPESGFFGGGTDAKGYDVFINFGLLKNIWLNLQYFRAKQLTGLRQTDNSFRLNFNFKI